MEEAKSRIQAPTSVVLFSMIMRNKLFIILTTSIVTIASVIYSLFIMKVEYKSTANLVPPQGSLSSLEGTISSIGSALKDFGLQSFGGGDVEGYSYKVVLYSRSVIDSVINKYDLAKVYDIPDTMMNDVRKEFMEHSSIVVSKDGNYTISIWDVDKQRAADIANDYANIANDVALRLSRKEADFNMTYMEQRLEYVDNGLSKIADSLKIFAKKYGVYFPEEQAKGISEVLSDLKAQEFALEMMVGLSESYYGKNDYKTQMNKKLLEQIKEQLDKAENQPGLAGKFSLSNAADVTTEYSRLYVEYETYSKVKAILIPTLEKARLDTRKNVKNLFVLDEAIPAEKKDRPKRSFIVAGSFVGSFVFCILILGIISSYREFKKEVKIYDESQSN